MARAACSLAGRPIPAGNDPAVIALLPQADDLALIEALAEHATGRVPGLSLNVHLLNPAVRLYRRSGFAVAGAGRGQFGIAMQRSLAT